MTEKNRTVRKVSIADHLWEEFDNMADEMGASREALLNQAMFMFARLNGFLTPGASAGAKGSSNKIRPQSRVRAAGDQSSPGIPAGDTGPVIVAEDVKESPSKSPASPIDDPVAAPKQSRGKQASASGPLPVEVSEDEIIDGLDEIDDGNEVAEEDIAEDVSLDESVDVAVDESGAESAGKEAEAESLYLMTADGELRKVAKDRFVIGRGKSCDLVIPSGKVSREHAMIVADPEGGHFMEDLNSSNGTWFRKKRLSRRRIEDGDEFFISAEKIKCVIR